MAGALTTDCTEFYENLTKNMKVIKYCENNSFENGCIAGYSRYEPGPSCSGYSKEVIEQQAKTWVFSDGSLLIPYTWNGSGALFLFDINGRKGPNTGGKDLFSMMIFKTIKGNYYLGLGGCTGYIKEEDKFDLNYMLLN